MNKIRWTHIVIILFLLFIFMGCNNKAKISNYYIETAGVTPQQEWNIKKDICNKYLVLDNESTEISTSDSLVVFNKEFGAIWLLNARILPDSNFVVGLHKVKLTLNDSLKKYHVEVFVTEDSCTWKSIRSLGEFDIKGNEEEMYLQMRKTLLSSIIK